MVIKREQVIRILASEHVGKAFKHPLQLTEDTKWHEKKPLDEKRKTSLWGFQIKFEKESSSPAPKGTV